MIHKTLLAGTHRGLIEDLFFNMPMLECVTSSMFSVDIDRHIRFYKPELLILCLKNDAVEAANMVEQSAKMLLQNEIILAVIGDQEEVDKFKEVTNYTANVYLTRPLNNKKIATALEDAIIDRDRAREKRRLAEEKENSKKHILIVDDDPNVLEMLKSTLAGEYKVATAVNGGLALRFLSKKSTDLILLDYEMPIQSGPQVLTILRGSDETKDIPVVFLTGVKDTAKIAKVLALGPQGYLLKPVDTEKLLETIKSVLEVNADG